MPSMLRSNSAWPRSDMALTRRSSGSRHGGWRRGLDRVGEGSVFEQVGEHVAGHQPQQDALGSRGAGAVLAGVAEHNPQNTHPRSLVDVEKSWTVAVETQ